MAIVVILKKAKKGEFETARKDYKSYIKITLDLRNEIMALGGEYHVDAEKMLLNQGSKQEDIWGGGVNLETGGFETNAIINLRAGRNDSTEILEPSTRKKFLEIANKLLKSHVKKR